MKTHTRTTRLLRLAAAFFILHSAFFISRAAAQLAPTGTLATTGTATIPIVTKPATATTGTTTDEVVQLDVFNVDASQNESGYQAYNTTSGSRINTPLRDTPASISPFTREFMDDVGASTIQELLQYAGNMESDVTADDNVGFNDTPSLNADGGNNNFRIRGIMGGVAVNYGQSAVPTDLYNIGRAEISSGANSIINGLGPQGGMLTLTTNRANLQRNTANVTGVLGTWSNFGNAWDFKRLVLNYNVVLMPKIWALRLQGVIQDGSTDSWRANVLFDQKRLNPVMSVKPWKNTTLTFEYEKGRVTETATRNAIGILTDNISGWQYWRDQQAAAGLPNPGLLQGFGSAYAPDPFTVVNPNNGTIYTMNPVAQINSAGTSPFLVYVNNNNTLYDFRQAYQGRSFYAGAPTDWVNLAIASYFYNTTGPNSLRVKNFERWSATLEQRIGNFNFQLDYNHNKTVTDVHAPNDNGSVGSILRVDPNTLVSPYIWGGSGTENLVPGPNPGGLYVEDVWMISTNTQTNNNYRLSAETSFNLRSFGRHRLVAMLERTEQDRFGGNKREILADQNNVVINDSSAPDGGNNYVHRRFYVTPGDYNTYHSGDWNPMIEDLQIGNRIFHSQYVATGLQNAHIVRKINTAALTFQSYWLRDRLVTTFGGRFDTYDYRRELTERVTDLNDPRILNHTKVFNEWALNGLWNTNRYNAFTYSAGGVARFTNWLDGVINFSSNRGEPYLDGRTVLPNGTIPPLSRGLNTEYGLRITLSPEGSKLGRWNLRLTRYDTKQLGSAANIPDGTNVDHSVSLGDDNLWNIFDALYFLRPTGQTSTAPSGGWPAGTGPGAGPMPASMYAVTAPNPARYPWGAPPIFNAGTQDTRSQGYEAELYVQPTNNIEMRFTYSYTAREKINVFPEIFAYYNKNIPIWLDLADPSKHFNINSPDGSGNYFVSGVTVNGVVPTLRDYIWSQLYGTATSTADIRDRINNQLYNQSGPLGSQPQKFNVTGKYKFNRNGLLKGLEIGGSVRYRSPNLIPDPNNKTIIQAFEQPPDDTRDLALDPQLYFGKRAMIKGNSETIWSMFSSYRCKLFGGRTTMTLRFNIDNLFNNNVVRVGRRNANGYISRVYFNTPRAIRFTTDFEF